jgi:hypothetical protein
LITLIPNEEDMQIPEGLPSIMPDEFFTILSKHPAETENVRLLLRILRQTDRERFYSILFEVYSCVGAEVEDTARGWRNSRLEVKGLLDFEEAVEIYGYVSEEEAEDMAKGRASTRSLLHKALGPDPKAIPTYPMLLAETRNFFYDILASIEDISLANRLRSEVAFCANRVLVADARSIGEIESMGAALQRLFSLVNVGLLFSSGGDREEALRILGAVPVRDLFQIGFSRVVDLKTRAREIAKKWWPKWPQHGFPLLEHPRDEVLRGVLMRVPQYYGAVGGSGNDFRDFETMEEVVTTRQIIDEVGVIAEACFSRLGLPLPHEAELDLDGVLAGGIEEISIRRLVLTGFVHFAVTGAFEISPLPSDYPRRIFEKVLEKSGAGERLIREGLVTRFLAWLKETTQFENQAWTALKMIVEGWIRDLGAEIGGMPSWEAMDPRYMRNLIFGTR